MVTLFVIFILFEIALTVLAGVVLWAWVLLVPPYVVRVRRLYFGAGGLAVPGIIFLTDRRFDYPTLRHEYEHIRQMKRYSPLGLGVALGWYYGKGFLMGRFKKGRWPCLWELWRNCPIEREANDAMKSAESLPRIFGRLPEA